MSFKANENKVATKTTYKKNNKGKIIGSALGLSSGLAGVLHNCNSKPSLKFSTRKLTAYTIVNTLFGLGFGALFGIHLANSTK